MSDQEMSNRMAILIALKEEQAQPNPSEAVIAACEFALRAMPDLRKRTIMHVEMTQKDV